MPQFTIPVSVGILCRECKRDNFNVSFIYTPCSDDQYFLVGPCKSCLDSKLKEAYEKGAASRNSEVAGLKERTEELEATVRRVGLKDVL